MEYFNKSVIVLDLDHTLVHSVDEKYLNENKITKIADGKINGFHVFIRPDAREFVNELMKNYEIVGVWSFGTSDYVDYIINLLSPMRSFNFVYSLNTPPPGKKDNEKYKNISHIDNVFNKTSFIVDDLYENTIYNINRAVIIRKYFAGSDDENCLRYAYTTLNILINNYFGRF
jgi:hypothetical protein